MSGTETLRFRKAEMPRSTGLNDTHRENCVLLNLVQEFLEIKG